MSKEKRWMLVFFTIVMTLLISAAASARTQEFNDRLKSGDSIDLDDFTFTVTMNKYANAIFITGGGLAQSVPLEGCEDMEHFEVCFDNTTYDEEENELFALVRVFRYKPVLSITKTANDSEVYVGQDIKVTIKITNTGDNAEQVVMTDDYPQGIEISDLEGGCQVHENQVYWQGHLDEGKEKECNFLIRPTKELHQSVVAHLKYWDGFKWVDEYSPTMTFDVLPVVEVFSCIVREDYEVDGTTLDMEEDNPGINIGETLRLLVNITNNYNDRIDVRSLEISLPPNLVYESTGMLRFNFINASGNRSSIVWYSDRVRKIGDRLLRWEGGISANKSSRLFIIKLKATKSGRHNVLVNADYEYDDMVFNESNYEGIDVSDPGIGIRMNIDDKSKMFSAPTRLDEEDDSIDLEARHPYQLRVFTQNLNKYAVIKDADVKVYTDIAGFPAVHYSLIEEEGQKIPYSVVLIPPQVTASTEFKTNVSVAYMDEFGEQGYNSTEFLLTVKPASDITITVDSSEGETLDGGEESEIAVSVNNERLVDLRDVEIEDIIPEGLHVEGVHAKRLKLNRETDTDVYKYRIKAPIVHNRTDYYIITTVSFFDPDSRMQLNYTENTTIKVEPLQPDVSITLSLDEPDEIYPGTLIPVEYTVRNEEESEMVREITVNFPILEEIDLIGPKSFFIDKLNPGEEVVLKNLVKLRPKVVNDSLDIGIVRVVYQDDYGNWFDENSTEDTLDVDTASINGPAVFVRTIVPEVINRSSEGIIRLDVSNVGSDSASVSIEQGEGSWSLDIPAYSTKSVEYKVVYDNDGNYTLPDPVVKVGFQGLEGYTLGRGATVVVKYIEGPAAQAPPAEEQKAAEAVVAPELEKEEMSFEEFQANLLIAERKKIMKYSIILVAAIVSFVLVWMYINYRRKKGVVMPFTEGER